MKKYFCTECNTKLQIKEIEDIEDMSLPQLVCMNCSKIEVGYEAHEKKLVLDLQGYFKDSLWMVSSVLLIFRRHLRKKES